MGDRIDTILNLPARYNELAEGLTKALEQDFSQFGLGLSSLYINAITPPPEVQKAIDDKSRLGVFDDLNKLLKMKAAMAMEAAASNQGEAGAGMGMGMGFMMPAFFAEAFRSGSPPEGNGKGPVPPPSGGGLCPACSQAVPREARFCPACGQQIMVIRRCTQCGEALPANARFCTACGRPTEENPDPASAVSAERRICPMPSSATSAENVCRTDDDRKRNPFRSGPRRWSWPDRRRRKRLKYEAFQVPEEEHPGPDPRPGPDRRRSPLRP